ncbi:bifunctional folylpolyglutamate synthase/dihydrofolate synthase [Oceanirhabdus sp. W0125-5]|uniref:bifunctional folylpolyglutamate synthase/dihydrofolate synthase n=1 Tax=Oceanirhabdus sp. W0125-5 TaxID=2999116 RepID=UPI0022F2FF01|nr:folylpolyglutamate synthase/dihydrofolate synthase family protein [Oceanirhabdus sp. W0125-5]WBW99370.1 bifunctional folylpolyglutamate synthase/dihydrofolate synthase [Oceanirhabdus sp. W0125-5]
MNYSEAMEFLNSSSKFGWKLGLERITKMLELLGNPHKGLKFIHIAGTNGKGSTTAMISSVLMEAGYKTGMYTSPFIETFGERIQVDGKNITEDKIAEYMLKIKNVSKHMSEYDLGEITYFEIVTAIGFLYFKDMKIDIGVIEVGLGGRFDATNVIDPILTIITSISYDHTHILGNSLSEIAFEKAGIIKEGVPLVLYPVVEEAYNTIKKVANEKNADILYLDSNMARVEAILKSKKKENAIQLLTIKSNNKEIKIKLPLVGAHQVMNCLVAVNALFKLNEQGIVVTEENIVKGIEKVKWPGRMELMIKEPRFLIDGAHNIDAIRYLKENLKSYYEYKKLYILVGILSDKDIDEMIKIISCEGDEVITLTPNNIRAENSQELSKKIAQYNPNVKSMDNYREAIEYVMGKAGDKDLILACGSLYLIGELRGILKTI